MKGVLFYLLIQLVITNISAQNLITSTHLYNINGNQFEWKNIKTKLTAIVFLAPDCPISQQYTLLLKQLETKYKNSLTIIGIFAGKNYIDNDYLEFQKKYSINFNLLIDSNYKLTRMLKATVTPEVFLLDDNSTRLYYGAIDNKFISLGKSRLKATENYLENSIQNYLHNLPNKNLYNEPVGCLIEN